MSQEMTPRAVILGSIAILLAVVFVMVFWPYATQNTHPSEIFRERTHEENAGRALYIANGCVYCHTQSVRSIDWDQGAERIAQAGDYVADQPILLGSERTGVDLSQEGGEHPDDWHMAHFTNPRYTRTNSIMPRFEYLGTDDISRLTHYVQSLGGKSADHRTARQDFWKAQLTAHTNPVPYKTSSGFPIMFPKVGASFPIPIPHRMRGLPGDARFTRISVWDATVPSATGWARLSHISIRRR